MEILRYILIAVEVLCCLMLIGVILLQQSKSQGMGLAFGGGMTESLFGSRAGNVLTKFTVILALVFLANTTLLGILYTTRQDESLVEQAPAPAAPAVAPIAPPPAQDAGMMTAPVQPVPVDGSGTMLAPDAAVPVMATEEALAPIEVAPVVESVPVEPAAATEPAEAVPATP